MGFDPLDHLDGLLQKRADLVRYFVHKIIWSNTFGLADEEGFVSLKAEYLRRFFPESDVYLRVRESLISSGAILCDNHYIKGEKCYGYKLGPELSKMRQRSVVVTDRYLRKKIARHRAEPINLPEGVHRHLHDHLETVQIDQDTALKSLLAEDFKPTNETAIGLIHDGDFFFHVCDYGRVHTNLTNLKSSLRQHLRVGGEALVNLDIRNSQPLIFAAILKTHYQGRNVPPDVVRYAELVQAGEFYDYLMGESGTPNEERSAFKGNFFGRVFFCKNYPVTKEARLFGELFPNVHSLVREMKADDYRELARELQRRESSIIIGGAATRCMLELPQAFIGTIHDSVLTTSEHADAIKGIMNDEFRKVGLAPTIRLEATGR